MNRLLKEISNRADDMLNNSDAVEGYIVTAVGVAHDCSSHINGSATELMAMTCCIIEQIAEGSGSSIEHVLDTIQHALKQKEVYKPETSKATSKRTNKDLADKIAQVIADALEDDMED